MMFFKNRLSVIFIMSVLLLSACGGGDSSSSSTTTPVTPTTTISVSVKDIQDQYISGVQIHYGNDGQHSAATGSFISGVPAISTAIFLNAPVGSYDGHLTLSNGYHSSLYGITDTSLTIQVPFYLAAPSWIDVGITITGSLSATHYAYLVTAKKVYASSIVAGKASFNLLEYKPGDIVAGELIIAQGAGTSNAGNTLLFGGAESVSLGQQSFGAQSASGVPTQNFTANLSAAPVTPLIAKINSMSVPSGINPFSFYIGGATTLAPLTLPDDIYSSPVGIDYWVAKAQDATLKNFWSKQSAFTVGQTIDVANAFTSLITTTAQSGNTMSWTNAASISPITLTIVDIFDASLAKRWRAVFKGAVASWTLPTEPQIGLGSYTLNISNVIAPSLTLEQFASGAYSGTTSIEIVTLKGVSYTR